MSVVAKKVSYDSFLWETNGNIHTLKKDAYVFINIEKDGKNKTLKMKFKKGFKCDGLSVPCIFRWFLKSWDDSNPLYNIAGAIHDALYGNKGYGIFNRDECDAIFRGLLREAGCNRLHASTADLAVGIAAKSHWGDDNLDCCYLVSAELI